MDGICVIYSMHGDHQDHFQATLGIHTGSVSFARPALGSWVSYGLGTENQNLPSFVVLAPQLPYAGSQVWSSDFLPGCHQGTRVQAGAEPIPDLVRRSPSAKIQELELSLLDRFNRKHQQQRGSDPALAARIKSFETAFGMQKEMPEVLDLSKESNATLKLYGLERGSTKGFAWQCLVARRMAERGVRFIELIDIGSHDNWDAHADMQTHAPLAKNVDQPIAGLLKDLKSRGMLEDMLGTKAARLSLDDFYRDRSSLSSSRRAKINFDHPRAIDWARVERVLRDCRAGKTVCVPCYDFKTHCRVRRSTRLRPKEVMLV